MSRSRYRIFDNGYPYFMTCTIVAWLPIFSNPAFVEIVLNSWRFLQSQRQCQILAYVILENHLHWIANCPDLSAQAGRFKSFTAKQILAELQKAQHIMLLDSLSYYKARHKMDQDFQLWQEGSHPKQIGSDDMMWQKLEYIHNNPVKRGYVDDPTHWRYSSARNYAGKVGLLDVATDWQ